MGPPQTPAPPTVCAAGRPTAPPPPPQASPPTPPPPRRPPPARPAPRCSRTAAGGLGRLPPTPTARPCLSSRPPDAHTSQAHSVCQAHSQPGLPGVSLDGGKQLQVLPDSQLRPQHVKLRAAGAGGRAGCLAQGRTDAGHTQGCGMGARASLWAKPHLRADAQAVPDGRHVPPDGQRLPLPLPLPSFGPSTLTAKESVAAGREQQACGRRKRERGIQVVVRALQESRPACTMLRMRQALGGARDECCAWLSIPTSQHPNTDP